MKGKLEGQVKWLFQSQKSEQTHTYFAKKKKKKRNTQSQKGFKRRSNHAYTRTHKLCSVCPSEIVEASLEVHVRRVCRRTNSSRLRLVGSRRGHRLRLGALGHSRHFAVERQAELIQHLRHNSVGLGLLVRVGKRVIDCVVHHLLLHVHDLALLLKLHHDLLQRGDVHGCIHALHGLGDTLHRLGHGLCRLQHLDLQRHGLDLRLHLDHLLDVVAGAHKILGHDLGRVNLVGLGRLLQVCDDSALLPLQLVLLALQLPDGAVQGALVLLQHLLRCLPASKEPLHSFLPCLGSPRKPCLHTHTQSQLTTHHTTAAGCCCCFPLAAR
eukprot:m.54339 g.54339  ORF g.54339 m.54339 type:complete len:325 (-) comp13242_c0_seq2:34-1008(-)